MDAFDYVIVGAGSAGCVLANRLSADPAVSVALIEAGGSDAHPYVHMPRGVGKLMAMPAYMYFYMTQPEPHNAMRATSGCAAGAGCSSSVNGMVWVRGQPAAWDELAAATSEDWSWAQIARAFEAIEHHELGPAPSRGASGPLHISLPATHGSDRGDQCARAPHGMARRRRRQRTPMRANASATCRAPSGRAGGRARRWPSSPRCADSGNLTVITGALTDRLLFDGQACDGCGKFSTQTCRREIMARREVILCGRRGGPARRSSNARASAIPDLLASHGIPLVHAQSGGGGERQRTSRAAHASGA
jgi:choline dehydrogenase-like flavoprotein